MLFFPALPSPAHFGLGVNAEGVRDAVDVIEISNRLDGIEDVAVAQAMPAKRVDVLFADASRCARHKVGEFCQRLAARGQPGPEIIVLDVFSQLRVAAFRTEILPVSFDSIEAVVRPGDDHSQQFTLRPR